MAQRQEYENPNGKLEAVPERGKNATLREAHEPYIQDGKVKLYHFSTSVPANSVMLDPQRFTSSRNSWSRRESQISSFPRVFFYLDKEKTEPEIGTGTPFVATVILAISMIY